VAVLLGPEIAVRDESKAFKQSPGGDIGFIDARVDAGATAPSEEPVDQCGGGFAAVSHPVVIRVEQVGRGWRGARDCSLAAAALADKYRTASGCPRKLSSAPASSYFSGRSSRRAVRIGGIGSMAVVLLPG
jgi:hypothetical protein